MASEPIDDSIKGISQLHEMTQQSSNKQRSRIMVAFALLYVLWGSTYLAMRVVVRDMPPYVAGDRPLPGFRTDHAGRSARSWDERSASLAATSGACW